LTTDPDPNALETQEMGLEQDLAGRRTFRRVDHQVQVDLRSANNFFTGFSENISEGGLFVATEAPHPIGTVIEVTLTVMGGEPMTLRGEIAWIRPVNARGGLPPGFGLRFLGLEEGEQSSLQTFVDSKVKDTLFFDLD
jgi:uncharacterized protein (TIGR02266 family)